MATKLIRTALILAPLIFLTGCSNLLIADDTVFTLTGEMPQTAYVESMVTDQPGVVCSMTPDGSYILSIGKNNNTYTIDQYQVSTSRLINITTSDSQIYSAVTAGDGFFYTKENPADLSKLQLVWSTFDKSTERTITDLTDAPSEAIYAFNGDNVVYVNNGSELVFSDSNATKRRYALNLQLEVVDICWNQEKGVGFLIGQEGGGNSMTLYHLLLTNNELKTNPIATQVAGMDLSRNTQELAYLVQEDSYVQVYLLGDIETVNATKLFRDSSIDEIAFSDDAQALYYSKDFDSGGRSTIWHFDKMNRRRYQLTSPVRLNSVILPRRNANEIFFSASQLTYVESSDIILSNSYITRLEYTLPYN